MMHLTKEHFSSELCLIKKNQSFKIKIQQTLEYIVQQNKNAIKINQNCKTICYRGKTIYKTGSVRCIPLTTNINITTISDKFPY